MDLSNAIDHFRHGRFAEAADGFRRALEAEPANPDIANNLSIALAGLHRYEEAEHYARLALSFNNAHAEAHSNLGLILYHSNRHQEAEASLRKAIALRSDFSDAYNHLGLVLKEQGLMAEAADCFRQAIALNPNHVFAYNNLGIVLRGTEHDSEAYYRQAIALKPDFIEAYNNLAASLREREQFAEAENTLRHALALKPNQAETHNALALLLLLQGRFREGWLEHEWRWQTSLLTPWRLQHSAPQWRGEDLTGKTLLIYFEQGMGDIIQFARYVPLVETLAERVFFVVPPQMAKILSTLPGRHEQLIADAPLPAADYQLALMSLPWIFDTTADSVPAAMPYLSSDPALRATWRTRLGNDGFKIGICWQGNPNYIHDKARSFPLAALAPLAELVGVRLISLQKNDGLKQLERLPPGMTVEVPDGMDNGGDMFIDMAAIMDNLDLIISADTSVVHLAGALGRPVWMPLSQPAEWRWLLVREDCPWYPSLRLFRQKHPQEGWPPLFERMAQTLVSVLQGTTPRPAPISNANTNPYSEINQPVWLQFAKKRLSDGQIEPAIQVLEQTLESLPDAVEAWRLLATVQFHHGCYEAALKAFRRVENLSPDDPSALNDLATVLAACKQLTEAESWFRKALSNESPLPETYSNFALILAEQNRYEEALFYLQQVLQIRPDFIPAHLCLGQLLEQQNKFEQSAAVYLKALTYRPDDHTLQNNLGTIWSRLERWEEAEACYRKAIALAPDFGDAYLNLGIILQKHGYSEEAEEIFRKVRALGGLEK